MRISDWSSDVCSSDLYATLSSTVHASVHDIEGQVAYSGDGQIEAFSRAPDIKDVPFILVGAIEVLLDTDRKSVVSGKSVSVRVDSGGSGIIKKNKTRQ